MPRLGDSRCGTGRCSPRLPRRAGPQGGAVPLSGGGRRERRHRETHEARAPANGVPRSRTTGSNGLTSTPVNPHRSDSAKNAPNPTDWVATAARCGGRKNHPSTIPRGIIRSATRHLPPTAGAARGAAPVGRAKPHGPIAAPAGQRLTGIDAMAERSAGPEVLTSSACRGQCVHSPPLPLLPQACRVSRRLVIAVS
jgi:hypothetical protein